MTTVEMVRSLYMMRWLHEVHLMGSLRVSWWILPQRWHEYGSAKGDAAVGGWMDTSVCRGVGFSMTRARGLSADLVRGSLFPPP